MDKDYRTSLPKHLADRIPEANPLISKDVPPDEKVSITFDPPEQPRRQRLLHRDPFTDQLFAPYGPIKEADSLLHYFMQKKTDIGLLYAKTDNSKRCELQPSSVKYMASCYQAQEEAAHRTLPRTTFESDVSQSFGRPFFSSRNDLSFSSCFQSGNLQFAFVTGPERYELVLQNDSNSKGYTQWFMFGVRGMEPGQRYQFQIVNMVARQSETKNYSLFEQGLKPVSYSFAKRELLKVKWERDVEAVSYFENFIPKEDRGAESYFTLRFEYLCKYPEDTVVFASCLPYPLARLTRFLGNLDLLPKEKARRVTLGTTAKGHPIYAIQFYARGKANQDAVLLLARQHPGETSGSFVMEGVLELLLERSLTAEKVREQFNYIVVPMVNPDGVVLGNSRCNFMGVDLNRRWGSAEPQFSREVFLLKRYLVALKERLKFRFIIDLHGHSKKLNSFFYSTKDNPEVVRVYPFISARSSKFISWKDCYFTNTPSKRQTARVELSLKLGCEKSYAFQTSLYGYEEEDKQLPYSPSQMRQLGREIVNSLIQYSKIQANKQNFTLVKNLLSKNSHPETESRESEENNYDSQSQPERDQLDQVQKRQTLARTKPQPERRKPPQSTRAVLKTSKFVSFPKPAPHKDCAVQAGAMIQLRTALSIIDYVPEAAMSREKLEVRGNDFGCQVCFFDIISTFVSKKLMKKDDTKRLKFLIDTMRQEKEDLMSVMTIESLTKSLRSVVSVTKLDSKDPRVRGGLYRLRSTLDRF